jgi:hypothetical protein
MAAVATLFERLGRPPPTNKAQGNSRKLQHAQRTLDWLQRWSKPTVRPKDMRVYGPRPRDRESALSSAGILVEHGWLVPVKTRRHDSREWQIVRKPIIRPTVAIVADVPE